MSGSRLASMRVALSVFFSSSPRMNRACLLYTSLLERNKMGDLDYKSISKLYELEDKFDEEYADIMRLFNAGPYTVFRVTAAEVVVGGIALHQMCIRDRPEEAHWKAHMRADIALLVACDYIYMLKDWELSLSLIHI